VVRYLRGVEALLDGEAVDIGGAGLKYFPHLFISWSEEVQGVVSDGGGTAVGHETVDIAGDGKERKPIRKLLLDNNQLRNLPDVDKGQYTVSLSPSLLLPPSHQRPHFHVPPLSPSSPLFSPPFSRLLSSLVSSCLACIACILMLVSSCLYPHACILMLVSSCLYPHAWHAYRSTSPRTVARFAAPKSRCPSSAPLPPLPRPSFLPLFPGAFLSLSFVHGLATTPLQHPPPACCEMTFL
jgi:hypothetical protein